MSIEVEKKYRLKKNQFEEIQIILKDVGAEFIGENFEENILYRGGIITEKNAVLRIRKIENKNILTYKERLNDETETKHHTEYETEIKDAEIMEKIVGSLGFKKSLVYEKRRKTWELGNVEVVLDELPFGLFMEIEGEIHGIEKAEKLLKIEDFEIEHETYPLLTAKFGKKNGQIIEARFAD